MRLGLFVFAIAVCCAAPAAAQHELTLSATQGAPIIDALINDRPVRLEVDTRFPDSAAVSQAQAARLGMRRLLGVSINAGVEGGGVIRGRIARPRIVFGGRGTRAFAGVFAAPVSARADGVIGPGALPYDVVTITLGPEPAAAREIVFTLEDADVWRVSSEIGGVRARVVFDVGNRASVFNRTAARLFDRAGAIPATGDLAETPLILGLSTLMQPVETTLAVEGIVLRETYARTNAPLLGADDADATVIEAEGAEAPPPTVLVGRAALDGAGCASIRVERRTRRLVLRCAA